MIEQVDPTGTVIQYDEKKSVYSFPDFMENQSRQYKQTCLPLAQPFGSEEEVSFLRAAVHVDLC